MEQNEKIEDAVIVEPAAEPVVEPAPEVAKEQPEPPKEETTQELSGRLKAQYLALCSQLGEKQLHVALLNEESNEVATKLKAIAKELFPLMQNKEAK